MDGKELSRFGLNIDPMIPTRDLIIFLNYYSANCYVPRLLWKKTWPKSFSLSLQLSNFSVPFLFQIKFLSQILHFSKRIKNYENKQFSLQEKEDVSSVSSQALTPSPLRLRNDKINLRSHRFYVFHHIFSNFCYWLFPKDRTYLIFIDIY